MKPTFKTVLEYRRFAKNDPVYRPNYRDVKKAFFRKFIVVKAYNKSKWFLSQMFGVTCIDGDGDCDGTTETYAFRFFFWECYLGSTFTRSRTAPPDLPYGCDHGLSWSWKDLFDIRNWRLNTMFKITY